MTMAGTKSSRDGFWRHGGGLGCVLYLVSLSGAAEIAESQLGRANKRSNIRTEHPRFPDFPPGDDHVSGAQTAGETEGKMSHCSPLSSLLLLPPPLPTTISETD